MDARHERHARQLQERKSQVEKEVAEIGFERPPRRRDRNRFFNSLLNGEVAVYDEVRPRWQESRRKSREVRRLKRKLDAVVRRGVKGDPAYRALSAKVAREKAAMRACSRMIDLIKQASRQLRRVHRHPPRSEAPDARVVRDTREMSKRVLAVRKHALVVNEKISPHRSLNASDVEELDTEFLDTSAEHTMRLRKYNDAKNALSSLERRVRHILSESAERERIAKNQRLLYLNKERARFNGPAIPPS